MLDLKPEHERVVKDILRQYVPDAVVYAFGSRVTGKAKPHSDLDLVIVGRDAIPLGQMHLLAEAFDDSDLPFRVDVLDWQSISDDFRQNIRQCRERISGQANGADEP